MTIDKSINSGNDCSSEDNTLETYPASPVTHGVNAFFIVDDSNYIFETLDAVQRKRNLDRSDPADSQSPHNLGVCSPSWVNGKYEVGFYSSKTGLVRHDSSGDRVPVRDQRLRLYKSCDTGESARTDAKCTVIVEPRGEDLWSRSGTKFGYPAGNDGVRYSGSYFKIHSSYAQSPQELLSWVKEWLRTVDGMLGTDLKSHFDPIEPTYYVSGLERYVRFNVTCFEQIIHTLESTKRLVHTGDEGAERSGEDCIINGRYSIFSFSTTEMDRIGFTTGPERGVKKDRIKAYRVRNADQYNPSHYRHHPKIESKIETGKYHISEWDNLVTRADSILLTHLTYTSIGLDDLVADQHFQPADSDEIEFYSPAGRIAALREYWEDEATRRELQGLLLHSRTDSYKDVVLFKLFKGYPGVTYDQLVEATGLTKRSVRRIVKKLEDEKILIRVTSAYTTVEWMSQESYERVKAWTLDMVESKGFLERLEQRKKDRIERREISQNSNRKQESKSESTGKHSERHRSGDRGVGEEQTVEPCTEETDIKREQPAESNPDDTDADGDDGSEDMMKDLQKIRDKMNTGELSGFSSADSHPEYH